MKHSFYIYTVALILAFNLAGCDKTDNVDITDDMQQIEGIALGLGAVKISPEAAATTKATVGGITYAVNTAEDPTSHINFSANRITWLLDFHLFNNKIASDTKYDDGSFDGGTYSGGSWKPNPDKQLYFPNYWNPTAKLLLYPSGDKDDVVNTDQSDAANLLKQDLLVYEGGIQIAKKIPVVQLSHKRAMINFRFEGLVRDDINEPTVRVSVGGVDYTPYNVRATGTLEYLLILPENTPASSEITVKYETKGNPFQQPINYRQKVELIKTGTLGSNNCYCFTLSGKELKISPITIINWVTGEPVSGEYVAVTAYPTFKGPVNSTYYFYYDNKLTVGGILNGTPKLQEINFNNDGECTIKPDGRVVTHIFKGANPSIGDWNLYKLTDPIILGNTEKMYIDLETIINNLH